MTTKRLEWRVLMDLVEPYGTGFQLAANALYRFQVLLRIHLLFSNQRHMQLVHNLILQFEQHMEYFSLSL